jgi:hypothetical protein
MGGFDISLRSMKFGIIIFILILVFLFAGSLIAQGLADEYNY